MLLNLFNFTTLTLLICYIHISESHKFLVIGTTHSKSHMISAGRIADTLSKHGNQVVGCYN